MPAHEPPSEPGHERNRKIRARWRARERGAKLPLPGRMASLLSSKAGACEPAPRDRPAEVPAELLSLLESSFEVVSMVMQDDGLAA